MRYLLAAILVGTAGLKAYAVLMGMTPPAFSFISASRLQWIAAELELVLAVWVLSGWRTAAARQVLIWLFSGFAGFAVLDLFLLPVSGTETSCLCFGIVSMPPWVSIGAALVIVALSVAFRPNPELACEAPSLWNIMASAAPATAIALAVLGAAFVLVTPQPLRAWARMREGAVSVAPRVVEMGMGQPNETGSFVVIVKNNTDRAISVFGVKACGWAPTTKLPFVLSSGERRAVEFHARFPESPGHFRSRFVLYTAADGFPLVEVNGKVISAE